jgi:hypothetical protein
MTRPSASLNSPGLCVALLAAVSLSLPVALRAQDIRPRGSWRLDRASSDSLPPRFSPPPRASAERPGMEPGEGPGGEKPGIERPGEFGGGAGYGGGHGRRRDHGFSDKELARMRQTMALARQTPEIIAIAPDDSLRIVVTGGETVALHIGGGHVKREIEGGGEIETSAHWKSTALVVERKVKGGGKVTETYRLGLGGGRLLGFVEIAGLLQPLDFRRQYLPAGTGESSTSE